ncbi:YdcF family protein [Microbacterium sp. BWR-S6Y]|uniref:YdcF family protein n=1 Tax=Microbacterium sp. BWR-S6Y TaxID=3232073 RepID=UPI003528BBB1
MTTSSTTGALPTHRPLVRLGRAIRRTLLALVVAVAAIAVAGLPVYVFPPQGDPTGADLVYVIGPPQPQRLELASAIRDTDGHVPLLISVSDSRAGRGDSSFDADAVDECRQAGATCTTPEPFTTAGEARLLTAYVARQPAAETVVITYTPHVARTRYIFAKCYSGDVTVVGVDTPMTPADWAFQYVYQTAAFVKAWITPCP